MILEIDLGNTRLKWRVRKGSSLIYSGVALADDPLDDAISILDSAIEAVWVASVVPSRNQQLRQWCIDALGVEPEFAVVSTEQVGVINGYKDVSQMGVDRWLAILAAYDRVGGACLVVDSGSACTVDLISDEGRHLGGYIVPGLSLMKQALFGHTDRVQVPDLDYCLPVSAGQSTLLAVSGGLPLMLQGVIELAYAELCARLSALDESPQVLLSGGDGELFKGVLTQKLACVVEYVEPLVLDGLGFSERKRLVS